MRIAGFQVELRFPLWVARIRPYWCDRCRRYSQFTRDARCGRCRHSLRRVGP